MQEKSPVQVSYRVFYVHCEVRRGMSCFGGRGDHSANRFTYFGYVFAHMLVVSDILDFYGCNSYGGTLRFLAVTVRETAESAFEKFAVKNLEYV